MLSASCATTALNSSDIHVKDIHRASRCRVSFRHYFVSRISLDSRGSALADCPLVTGPSVEPMRERRSRDVPTSGPSELIGYCSQQAFERDCRAATTERHALHIETTVH